MPGHTRLYRRGATYYHRAAVPTDIKDSYGKREETFSLKTTDRSEALRRVRMEAVRVDQLFDAHRKQLRTGDIRAPEPELSELTPAQIETVKQAYLHHLLDEDEEVREDGFYDPDDTSEPLAELPRPTWEERRDDNAFVDKAARYDLARGKRDHIIRDEAEEVLTWDGLELRLAQGSPSWNKVIRALQEAQVQAYEGIAKRDAGDVVPTPPYPVDLSDNSATATRQDSISSHVRLQNAVGAWTAEKSRAWTDKARNDYLAWMTAFAEIAGNKPLHRYNKDDARAFKAVLLKLPPNWRKKPDLRNLSIQEAAALADRSGMAPMSTTNLNKALTRVGAFWSWAEAHYDDVKPSLFKGLSVRATVSARDQRSPFSVAQLSKLLSSPVFTGRRSERYCSEPGEHSMRGTARFWLPLLGSGPIDFGRRA